MSDRVDRVRLNTAFYYLQFAVTSLCTIAVAPLLSNALGAASFGLLKMCQRLVDLASFADGRAAQSLKTSLAMDIGRHAHHHQLQQLLGAAFHTSLRFIPLFFVVAVAGAVVMAASQTEPMAATELHAMLWVVGLLSLAVVLQPLLHIPDAALMAGGWSYRSSMVQIVIALLGAAAYAAVAAFDAGVRWAATVSVCMVLIGAWIMTWVARSTFHWYSIRRANAQQRQLFLGNAHRVLAWSAAEKLVLVSDVLLVGAFCGTSAVTTFTFSSYTFQLGLVVCLLGTSAMTPFITQSIGAGDRQLTHDLVLRARRKVVMVGVVGALAIFFGNQLFVGLWAGEANHGGRVLDALLALLLLQLSFIRAEGQFLDACQAWTGKAVAFAVATLASAGGLWMVSQGMKLRPEHVLVALLLGRVPLVWTMRWLSARHLAKPFKVNDAWCWALSLAALFSVSMGR